MKCLFEPETKFQSSVQTECNTRSTRLVLSGCFQLSCPGIGMVFQSCGGPGPGSLDSERFSSRMWRLKSRPSLSRCPQSLALHHSKQVVRLRHWALHIWSFASVEDVDLPNLMRKWVGCRILNFTSLALRELFSLIMEALKCAKMSEAHCPSGCANQSIFLSHHACLLTP